MIYNKKLKINIYSSIILISIMILFLSTKDSIANTERLKNSDYSITTPGGWFEIPGKNLEVYSKRIIKLYPHLPEPKYDFGFKLNDSQNLLDYPFILVQSNKTNPMPQKLLNAYEIYSSGKYPEMSKLDPGVWVYDKDNKMLWMYSDSRIIDVGPVSNLIGLKLTKKGYIQVTGTSLRSDFKKFEPVFISVACSVRPNAELIYKQDGSLFSKFKKVKAIWKIIGLLIIVIIISGMAIHRKLKYN